MNSVIAKGRVAVITGGAKGIGFSVAKLLAKQGMRVCIADTDQTALNTAANELSQFTENKEKDILTFVTNVASLDDVQALKKEVYNKFGEVTFLMNNAGIQAPSSSWGKIEEWKKVIDVNMYGVLNGQLTFLPDMIAQGKEGVIVNVGSKQGITNPPGNPAYNVSKSAVKTMTEHLAHDLRNTPGCKISAHLLIPGYTFTNMTSRGGEVEEKPAGAWSSDQVAERLVESLNKKEFSVEDIICPDNEVSWATDQKRIQWAAEDLTLGRPALSRWHPDFNPKFQEFLKN